MRILSNFHLFKFSDVMYKNTEIKQFKHMLGLYNSPGLACGNKCLGLLNPASFSFSRSAFCFRYASLPFRCRASLSYSIGGTGRITSALFIDCGTYHNLALLVIRFTPVTVHKSTNNKVIGLQFEPITSVLRDKPVLH